MARIRTFNKKIAWLSCKSHHLMLMYDYENQYSHILDGDSNGAWDFNPLLNFNMFKFIRFQDSSLYIEKDSVY